MEHAIEIWKDIAGYEGKYQVSNTGKVKSLNYHKSGNSREMKHGFSAKGYPVVVLRKDGKSTTIAVHRLVAMAFLPDYKESLDVDHINGIRSDNRVENLRMCTRKENCNFSISRRNRKQSAFKKSVLQFDMNGVLVAEYESTLEAERCTGISSGNIYSCCINRVITTRAGNKSTITTAGGYIWKFKTI